MSLASVSKATNPIAVAAGAPGRLSTGTVHVWFLDRTGPPENRWLEVLDAQEQERAMCFRTPDQRNAFAAAHALVRTALSAYGGGDPADWRFAISREGRPSVLGDSGLAFSLTHSGTWAAVAISINPALGIDLEPVRLERDSLPLARRFFGASETTWLERLAPGERAAGFSSLWTVKEAVLKARGSGLTEPLRSVEVDLDPSGHPVSVRGPGAPWALCSWSPEPGWCAAVAMQAEGALNVTTFRARALGPAVAAPELGPEAPRGGAPAAEPQ